MSSSSDLSVLSLAELRQYPAWILDQVEQAARPARPPRWVVTLSKCGSRGELVMEVDWQSVSQLRTELASEAGSRRRGRKNWKTVPIEARIARRHNGSSQRGVTRNASTPVARRHYELEHRPSCDRRCPRAPRRGGPHGATPRGRRGPDDSSTQALRGGGESRSSTR